MSNLAIIITGQLRNFFSVNNGLKKIIEISKKKYNLIHVICILNSDNLEDYNKLKIFFNEINITLQIINYTLYEHDYKNECINKIKNNKFIELKNNNNFACRNIGGNPDEYSIKHSWIQFHQLKIGIDTLLKYIENTKIEFHIVCKTRFDSKYPTDFFPHIPESNNFIDIISFNDHNKIKIINSMNENNIKNMNELINFNKNTRLHLPHIPLKDYALCLAEECVIIMNQLKIYTIMIILTKKIYYILLMIIIFFQNLKPLLN